MKPYDTTDKLAFDLMTHGFGIGRRRSTTKRLQRGVTPVREGIEVKDGRHVAAATGQ